ncbi:MAG TPA: aminotransferase class I/II-fold pyridoxal phosphate-dependent enzyme, partial [Thermoanaerobaculia bacterium]|nr:aminotransferase class I/II-fold pyridoxal phosphate-dependent enzyme [Thermoanaerobaculia bacterium]
GNGSNELLFTTIATFVSEGRQVIFPSPTFPLYDKLVTICGGTPREVMLDPASGVLPVNEMIAIAARSSEPPLFIVCSPNNPTGGVLRPGDLDRLLATGGMVVLDRAYGEFSSAPPPSLHERLVTLSTLSKAWGLAGFRIGWLMSTEEICREIRKVKLPYGLNIFSEQAALAMLERRELMERNVEAIIKERERMRYALEEMEGVETFPGEANFIAFRVARGARVVFESLLARGILVRDVSPYPAMNNALRVSVGTSEENDRFLEALQGILSGGEQ